MCEARCNVGVTLNQLYKSMTKHPGADGRQIRASQHISRLPSAPIPASCRAVCSCALKVLASVPKQAAAQRAISACRGLQLVVLDLLLRLGLDARRGCPARRRRRQLLGGCWLRHPRRRNRRRRHELLVQLLLFHLLCRCSSERRSASWKPWQGSIGRCQQSWCPSLRIRLRPTPQCNTAPRCCSVRTERSMSTGP